MSFENKFVTVEQYLRKISGQEKEVMLVDHNYVKPWNSHPDSHRTKPARLLFMKGLQRYSGLSNNRNLLYSEDIDVVRCGKESVLSPFDNLKMKHLPSECQQLFAAERNDPPDLNTCMPKQKRLYQDVVKVLNADRLARLTYSGTPLECVKVRLVSENSACLLREIFGGISWDSDLLSWLHKTILDSCCFEIIASYISVLQALRTIVPTLVDKLLSSHSGSCTNDLVMQIVKKQYDPILPLLNQYKTKKLPGNPIILISPSGPSKQMANSPRFRFWHNHLSSLCKVMNVPVYSIDEKCPTTVEDCLDQIITSLRNKVIELRNHYPNRPIILLGWTIGALIACHVALQEHVAAVICLGFPLTGVNGSRGDLKDPLLDSKVPTLFVVGQNASMCSSDDVEDFRARMKAETALVIVGGADDFLRLSAIKMHMEHVTQSMIDRCILDEISDFLLSVFIKLPAASVSNMLPLVRNCTPIKESSSELREDEGKRKRRKPREYSPELSPVRKRSRHHIPRQKKNERRKKGKEEEGKIANIL